MGRNQHGTAFVAQFSQQGNDPRLGLHIDAGKRLIEQDHFAFLSNGAGEEHALFLPAGELANLSFAVFAHPYAGQRGINNLPVAGLRPPQPAHMTIAAHHHYIFHQYRKRPVHLFRLRYVGNKILPKRAVDRLAENGDIAVSDAHEAHQRFE